MGGLPFFDAACFRLERLAAPGLLCAFDFDGTLAPIVRQPEKAAVPSSVLLRLQRLAARTPLAIISGRSVDDLRRRLPFEPHYLVGNHGMEGLPGLDAQTAHWHARCAAWEASLRAALSGDREAAAGIVVENKGSSLALHYRLAPDRDAAWGMLLDLCGELSPQPHMVGGKCVINLLPASGFDKAYALQRLIEASGAHGAFYAGDDLNDEDVFRLRRPDVLSVRIEREANSSAEFFLAHRLDLVRLLDELLRRLA